MSCFDVPRPFVGLFDFSAAWHDIQRLSNEDLCCGAFAVVGAATRDGQPATLDMSTVRQHGP